MKLWSISKQVILIQSHSASTVSQTTDTFTNECPLDDSTAHTHAELGGDWVISATYITSLPPSFPLKTFSSAMITNFLYSSRSRYFVNSLFINISGTLIDKSYAAGIQTLYLCTVDKFKVCFSMFLHINRLTCRNRLCFSALWDCFYCPSIRETWSSWWCNGTAAACGDGSCDHAREVN